MVFSFEQSSATEHQNCSSKYLEHLNQESEQKTRKLFPHLKFASHFGNESVQREDQDDGDDTSESSWTEELSINLSINKSMNMFCFVLTSF